MHLRGRFKRKQRAGSYWFSKGNVPLNTITAHIDYAYFTIPLINSAITVKVWLYKSNNIDNNYFYKIN
jgi:ribosomal protein S3